MHQAAQLGIFKIGKTVILHLLKALILGHFIEDRRKAHQSIGIEPMISLLRHCAAVLQPLKMAVVEFPWDYYNRNIGGSITRPVLTFNVGRYVYT